MAEFDAATHPHRRYNPLTKEHVLVSPHRTKRPWQGQTEPPQTNVLPEYDPTCYLCPGNSRSGGQQNPSFTETFTFENDFAAILPGPPPVAPVPPHPLMTSEPVHGACDVLIFHPRHDLTIARLSFVEIGRIIDEWTKIYVERGSQEGIKYVQIFENKGAMMGCSNPHPHGQVWSLSAIPSIPAQELRSLKEYASSSTNGATCLLCEYAQAEVKLGERVVLQNDDWVALVPWWAIWPFEVMVLPYKRHIESVASLSKEEKLSLATIISGVTKKYDNLFSCSFAYSMGIHQRPTPRANDSTGEDEDDFAHFHMHFEPPLLRSATVRKFLVGFELMAEPQRDLTPEQAASRLRACSDVHYLESNSV